MGSYYNRFVEVQQLVYAKNINGAKIELKSLLLDINEDYKKTKNVNEMRSIKQTMDVLIPVLNDLKAGQVTDRVITGLKLNKQKIVEIYSARPQTPSYNQPSYNQPAPSAPQTPAAPQAPAKPAAPKKPVYNTNKLAPLSLDDYIGQAKAKEILRVSIKAAKMKHSCLNHVLICSHYGLGKTTLAKIMASEMEMPFLNVNASALKDTKALVNYFSKITETCVIFIDEIHTLSKPIQTVLLTILTDYVIDDVDSDGTPIHVEVPPFTLIGATTQAGELLKPFINRFQIIELVDYTEDEKKVIVRSKFKKLGYTITEDACEDVAKRSRGIPRTMEIYAKGISDIALTEEVKEVTKPICERYFEYSDIDINGLNKTDLQLLKILVDSDKPLGLVTLESKMGVQREDIEFRYEPYLIQLGLIEKTEKGRIATKLGHDYIYPPVEEPATPDTPVEETPAEETSVQEEAPVQEVTSTPVEEPSSVEASENSDFFSAIDFGDEEK